MKERMIERKKYLIKDKGHRKSLELSEHVSLNKGLKLCNLCYFIVISIH